MIKKICECGSGCCWISYISDWLVRHCGIASQFFLHSMWLTCDSALAETCLYCFLHACDSYIVVSSTILFYIICGPYTLPDPVLVVFIQLEACALRWSFIYWFWITRSVHIVESFLCCIFIAYWFHLAESCFCCFYIARGLHHYISTLNGLWLAPCWNPYPTVIFARHSFLALLDIPDIPVTS